MSHTDDIDIATINEEVCCMLGYVVSMMLNRYNCWRASEGMPDTDGILYGKTALNLLRTLFQRTVYNENNICEAMPTL